MRISVLINNYNYAPYLVDCLESVFAQARAADEIIVVDDGSTDSSLEILKPFAKKIRTLSQKNRGQLSAIKRGVEAATGDILCFLDSDDTWDPNHLQEIEAKFRTPNKPDYVFTKLQRFGRAQGVFQLFDYEEDLFIPRTQQLMLVKAVPIGAPTSANAIKAEYAKRLFSMVNDDLLESFRICADEVLFFGTSLMGCSKYACIDATVNYRVHGANNFHDKDEETSRSIMRNRRNLIKATLSERLQITPDLDRLEAEFIDILDRVHQNHALSKWYTRAPQRLKLTWPKRLFWQSRLRRTAKNTA